MGVQAKDWGFPRYIKYNDTFGGLKVFRLYVPRSKQGNGMYKMCYGNIDGTCLNVYDKFTAGVRRKMRSKMKRCEWVIAKEVEWNKI